MTLGFLDALTSTERAITRSLVTGRGATLAEPPYAMIKLTRLHNQVVLVNPDHIYEAEARPDTTLRLVNGETIIVRETLDELIDKVVEYRRRIAQGFHGHSAHDAAAVVAVTVRHGHDGLARGGV